MRKIHFWGTEKDLKRIMQITGLTGLAVLSMTVYFFTGFLNSYVLFVLLLGLFTVCYFGSGAVALDSEGTVTLLPERILKNRFCDKIELLWCLPLVSLVIGYAQGSWKMGNLIDLIVITCCLVFVLNPPRAVSIYTLSLNIFKGFSLFFAVSIWIQMLLPEVYEIYLNALNNGSGTRINQLTSYYSGFTTSPGHLSTYIALGICAYLQDSFGKKWYAIIAEVFLLVSLFFAGMRMPVLAVAASIVFFVLMIIPGKKRKTFLIFLLKASAVALLVVIIFQAPLRKIPVVNRTFASIESLFKGGDASSGRIGLYKHALSLFAQHPFFGIGWGNFKDTVVGVVTKGTPFEVHNIYLQLLCETGIIGCVCFVTPMIYTLVKTVQHFTRLWKKKPDHPWTRLLAFSCLFQIYFLVFGMTDNVLFYTAQEICYLMCCSVTVAYAAGRKRQQIRKRKKQLRGEMQHGS